MLGAIIGDITGSIYEVEEIKNIKKDIDYNNRIKILDKNTPLFNNNCSYTDDTVLTCAIANTILTNTNYETNLKYFALNELSLGLDIYGRNRFSKGFIDWVNGNYIGESYGNGCAMRISPVAQYYNNLSKIIVETYKATYPSHNHIESINASKAVVSCIYLIKNNKSKKFIKRYIEKECHYNLDFNLEELQKNYKFTSKAKNTVPQAIYCFLVSNSFEDSIRKSISIGGDSDTIACITGSIAETYYGIDNKLINDVKPYLPEYVIDIVNKFYKSIDKEIPFNNDKQIKKSI